MGFMKLNINLASQGDLDHDRKKWLKGVTVALCAAAIFISLFTVVSFKLTHIQIDRHEERLSAAGGSVIKDIDKKELKRLNGEVAFVNSIIAMESFSWTSLLTSLEGVVSSGVALVQISPDFRDGSIRMRAMAETIGDTLKFIDALNASDEFSGAFLLSHSQKDTKKKPGSREKILFDISVNYSNGDSNAGGKDDGEVTER